MKKLVSVLGVLGALIVACSDDVTSVAPTNDSTPPAADSDGPATQQDAGPVTTPDAGDGGQTVLREQRCTAAGAQLLKPIDKISTGAVTILATEADGSRKVFVDASAGGAMVASTNPRVYLNLETLTRVDVTDLSAWASKGWDLALKRYIPFTNSGDGGSADGGAYFIADKDFAAVTAADIVPASFAPESFFEDDCTPKTDEIGGLLTSFDGWYYYESTVLTPEPGTWIVTGATGKHYKLAILDYYTRPGSSDQVSGSLTLQVKALD